MKEFSYAAGVLVSSLAITACSAADGVPSGGGQDTRADGGLPDGATEPGPVGSDPSLDAAAPLDDAAGPTKPDASPPADTPLDIACTPKTIDFQNLDPNGGGKVFTDHVADPVAFLKEAAHRVCTILYKNPSEVRSTPKVTLIIKPGGPDDVADTGGPTTRFYSQYLQKLGSRKPAEIEDEISGVIHHEFAHIYQNFGGDFPVIEGMADFVRYRSGFIPDSNRDKGGAWTDGYQTTAFFFVYLDTKYPDFGYKLNQAAASWPGDDKAFANITGKDVATLWKEYQASF
jgi:hypothetical protein